MLFSTLLTFVLVGSTKAEHIKRRPARHNALAERENNSHSQLTKRAFSGHGTWYYTGIGACGWRNRDSDYIVALNSAQYGGGYPGPQCGRFLTISANGVTVGGIQVTDECPTCGYGDLDLSPELFKRFGGDGMININWWFDGEGDKPPQSSTSEWVEPSTSTWVKPSTSEWVESSTTTTSSTTTAAPSSSSSSSSVSSSASATLSASASSTSLNNATNNATSSGLSSSISSSTTATAPIITGVANVSGQGEEVVEGNLQGLGSLVVRFAYMVVSGSTSN